jgi:hypothetical protein
VFEVVRLSLKKALVHVDVMHLIVPRMGVDVGLVINVHVDALIQI